jgi:D-amino-acid dehydrogenase
MIISPETLPGRHFDCVVVGAGVVGASIAQRLGRTGLKVLVLDAARTVGAGCSFANAAIVAPHHVTPLATPELIREAPFQMLRRPPALRLAPDPSLVPFMSRLMVSAARKRDVAEELKQLAYESTELHRKLAQEGHSGSLRKSGAIDVYLRRPRRTEGFLSFAEVAGIEPAVQNVAGGRYDSEEWILESQGFVNAMLADAAEHDVDVVMGVGAESLQLKEQTVTGVNTSLGVVTADRVVLAAGLATSRIAARAGLSLPMRGGRGYVVDLENPQGIGPTMPVRIKEHRIVVTPLDDRVRICGTMEFGNEGRPVDLSRGEALRKVAVEVLPCLADRRVVQRWAGERPCSADGLPAVGASKLVENLSLAAGHGMWGMILAPVTAQLIVDEMLQGQRESREMPWLSPDRFTRTAGWPVDEALLG